MSWRAVPGDDGRGFAALICWACDTRLEVSETLLADMNTHEGQCAAAVERCGAAVEVTPGIDAACELRPGHDGQHCASLGVSGGG